MLLGALSCLLGAIGLVRLPDLPARLQAATKPQTLGLSLILLGTALRVELVSAATLVLVVLFQVITAPVVSQLVGRASYRSGACRTTPSLSTSWPSTCPRTRRWAATVGPGRPATDWVDAAAEHGGAGGTGGGGPARRAVAVARSFGVCEIQADADADSRSGAVRGGGDLGAAGAPASAVVRWLRRAQVGVTTGGPRVAGKPLSEIVEAGGRRRWRPSSR